MRTAIPKMLAQARVGACVGKLSHLRIDVTHGKDCNIKEIVRPLRSSKLRPGQCMTTFVRITVPRLESNDKEGEGRSAELLQQLLHILGERETEMFTAEVSYKHSLFSRDTRLFAKHPSRIRRPNKGSTWTRQPTITSDTYAVEHGKALFIANSWSPDAAIERLRRKFRSVLFEPDHGSGLHRIIKELEFQRSVLTTPETQGAQHTFRQSHQRSNHPIATLHFPDTDVSMQSGSTCKEVDLDTSTSSLMTGSSDAGAPSDTPAKQDEARRIWRYMRRDSRSASLLGSTGVGTRQRESNESLDLVNQLEKADVKLREIRRQALQNKRSVGADTLRDFQWEGSRNGPGKGNGGSVPWLQ